MPVGTRDILVAVRARDVASRVIREVGSNMGRLGKEAAAAKAQMAAFSATTKSASAAHIAGIQASNRAMSTQNAQLALQTAQYRQMAAAGTVTAAQVRAVSTANAEVAATNRVNIAQNRQLIAAEQQRAAAAIAAHNAEKQAIIDKIALQQAAGRRMVNVGAAMTAVGVVMGAAGAAGLSALKGMADEAIEFGRQVAYARTQVDDVTVSVEELGAVTLRVGRKVPVAFEELNEALFDIFSTVDVGVPAAEHMLEQFSKAAVAGQTDVRTAARATMSLMNAFNVPVSETSRILDLQFKLVQKGVGTYDDFANQLYKIIPGAIAMGQEIETMFGLMTTLTRRTNDAAASATMLARGIEAFGRAGARENIEELIGPITDANGNFMQMDDIILRLMQKFKSLGEADFMAALTAGMDREGRVQMRRFFSIMREGITDAQGRIDGLTDSAGEMERAFLGMAEQPFARMKAFENAMHEFKVTLGQEVIPLLLPLVEGLNKMLKRITDMDPVLRKNIVRWAALGAAFLLIAGTVTTLAGVFVMIRGAMIAAGVSMGTFAIKALLINAAVFAVIGVLYLLIFHMDEVRAFMRGAFSDTAEGAFELARAFTRAMSHIISVVVETAMAVHRALSWLNPRARHSPSLVEDVTSGVAEIVNQFKSLSGIIPAIDSARAAVARFHDTIRVLRDASDAAARAELEQYLSVAGSQAVAAYDAAQAAVADLEQQLVSINQEYQKQWDILEGLREAVEEANAAVKEQEAVVKAAGAAVEEQERTIARLESTLRDTGVQLQNARDRFRELEQEVRRIEDAIIDAERRMQEFARAPLEGSREFSDQLFALDQQAALVRQEMLKWEAAGAPPEALDYFRLQLEDIARQAEAVRLEEQLELDPLRRALEQAADTTEELTFEEALEGINAAKEEIAELRDELPKATKSMLDQAKVVEQLEALYELQEAAVEAAKQVLDEYKLGLEAAQEGLRQQQEAAQAASLAYQEQQEVLSQLETTYRNVATEIGNLRSEMEQMVQVAQEQFEALEQARKAAEGAGGAGGVDEDALEGLRGLEPGELEDMMGVVDDFGEAVHGVDNFIQDLDDSSKDLAKRLEKLEELGKKLAPILNAVAAGAAAIIAINLAKWIAGVIALVGGPRALIGLLTTLDRVVGVALIGAFRGLVGFFTASLVPLLVRLTTAIIPALGGALAFLAANPVVLIIAALALLVLGLGVLIIKVGSAREAFDRAWEAIKDATQRLKANLIGALRVMIDWILSWAENTVGAAAEAFGWVPGVGEKLERAHEAIKAFREKSNAELAALQRQIRYDADITPAMRKLKELRDTARALEREFGYNIGSREAGGLSGGVLQGAQHGGRVWPGMLMVGEAGPELLQLGTTGRVYTNQESQRMMRGGGGNHVTIEEGAIKLEVQGSIDSATLPQVERMMQDTVDQLSDELRSRFGE